MAGRKKMAEEGGRVVSREEAEEAVRVLLRWVGEDPLREGLLETPSRVVRSYEEMFGGVGDPGAYLGKTFEDEARYGGLVLLKDIPIESHCEHHVLPIVGVAHVGYLPGERVVGLSKISRFVEGHARRLQTQERLTRMLAEGLLSGVGARGAGVVVEAEHYCMKIRGVRQGGVTTVTESFVGEMGEVEWLGRFRALLGGVGGGRGV